MVLVDTSAAVDGGAGPGKYESSVQTSTGGEVTRGVRGQCDDDVNAWALKNKQSQSYYRKSNIISTQSHSTSHRHRFKKKMELKKKKKL